MAEELLGCWELVSSEGFDEYMKGIGVSYATRKAAGFLKPVVTISKNGEKWSIKTVSAFTTTDLSFTINELFDENTADDRKCKTIVTLEDGKLIQLQKWDGKESTITREVKNGQMITICIFGDVKCNRVYQREKPK
ncbi:PREDICTED: myelin P2 protein-like [Nanorana parkeri]|uniref:myelin P2 protein-like n=1 Tax=Nanorana parkeri TaxID=125878 RepID=UPI0008546F9C|nr:PREDICTED: myelin P2 protein-like [Nanorana parkeri]